MSGEISAITVVPGFPVGLSSIRSMQPSVAESVSRTALHLVRWPSVADSVMTVNLLATPKFAIAPMPKVPTTPAARASGLFFPLDPALQ